MAGGKKTSKGAAASAAAHAASKRKSAAVEMTADNEARVRSALEVSCTLPFVLAAPPLVQGFFQHVSSQLESEDGSLMLLD